MTPAARALAPSSTARIGPVVSRPRSRTRPAASGPRWCSRWSPRPGPAGAWCDIDVDAERDHAQVLGEVHAVDHDRDQIQLGQVGGEQVGLGVLGHRHELPRDRRLARRPRRRGDLLADRLQAHRVAAGGQPGEHLLHRHLAQQLGAVEQLICRHRQLTGAVDRTHPRPPHRHPAATQRDRPGLATVPGRGPIHVVLALRAARRGHVGGHQLAITCPPSPHSARAQRP